jgi:hypothetical protein
MSNQIEQRMDDDGYKTLTEQEVADMKKKPSVLERIKAKIAREKSFSYNGKPIKL